MLYTQFKPKLILIFFNLTIKPLVNGYANILLPLLENLKKKINIRSSILCTWNPHCVWIACGLEVWWSYTNSFASKFLIWIFFSLLTNIQASQIAFSFFSNWYLVMSKSILWHSIVLLLSFVIKKTQTDVIVLYRIKNIFFFFCLILFFFIDFL